MTERSKLSAEVTSNYSGELRKEKNQNHQDDEGSTNEYIVVTLLIASKSKLKLSEACSSEVLRENLRILGSISSSELMALEIIWQPEGAGEILSAENLVTSYPNLQHL